MFVKLRVRSLYRIIEKIKIFVKEFRLYTTLHREAESILFLMFGMTQLVYALPLKFPLTKHAIVTTTYTYYKSSIYKYDAFVNATIRFE